MEEATSEWLRLTNLHFYQEQLESFTTGEKTRQKVDLRIKVNSVSRGLETRAPTSEVNWLTSQLSKQTWCDEVKLQIPHSSTEAFPPAILSFSYVGVVFAEDPIDLSRIA